MRAPFDIFKKTGLGRVLSDHPVTAIDIGARGGFETDLAPIAFAVNAIAAEPEREAYEKLLRLPPKYWRTLKYVNACIGDGGHAMLNVMADPVSSTILEPDRKIADRFDKKAFATIIDRFPVETMTLDQVVQSESLPDPDYLKIDVEGAERLILEAAPAVLGRLNFIKTEVAFLRFRKGQPLASEMDEFLRGIGFALLDYRGVHRWRMNGYVIHPWRDRCPIPYARGQIIAADALYARTPDSIADGAGMIAKRIKAAGLLTTHGYVDHAEEMLRHDSVHTVLKDRYGLEPTPLLDEASRVLHRHSWKDILATRGRRLASIAAGMLR